MKKTIVISLVAALTLSTSSVIARAEPADITTGNGGAQNQTVRTVTVKTAPALQQLPKEISGVITEFSEFEMKVKTDDGKVYTVPLRLFEKAEGFSDLELAKDVKVSLKSMEPVIVRSDAKGSGILLQKADGAVALPGAAAGEAVAVEKLDKAKLEAVENRIVTFSTESGSVAAGDAKLLELKDGKLLFLAGEITANGKTVKADIAAEKSLAIGAFQAQPSEISGTVESIDENGMTVKTGDEKEYWIPIAEFNQLEDFKALGLKAGSEVSVKSAELEFTTTSTIKNVEGDVTVSIARNTASALTESSEGFKPGKIQVAKAIDLKDLSEGKLIYIADEITSGGKTVKLSK